MKLIKIVAGGVSAAILLFLSFGTLAVVFLHSGGAKIVASDWYAIRFTVVQALISATLSVLFAIPVARALARQEFPGRNLVITLLGAPFLLPAIVAVLGLLAVFGRQGWWNSVTGFIGLEPISIFGFHGVVLAHVFFNLPLVVRLILQHWQAEPVERFRIAASLNAGPWAQFKLIEMPILRAAVPGAFLLVFLLCLTSFAVVLALGGGPKATTIELAIYQAFRFEFDLGHAAILAAIQFAVCVGIATLAWIIPLPTVGHGGLGRPTRRYDAGRSRGVDLLVVMLVAAFVLAPLVAVVLNGFGGLSELPGSIWAAAFVSICVAIASTVLCIFFAMTLSLAMVELGPILGKFGEAFGLINLATSPLVIGTGLFLVIFPFARPGDYALLVTIFVNAVMALPFVLRGIFPRVQQVYSDHNGLAKNLGMGVATWGRWVLLPAIRPALGFGAGLAAALSMGDLGVIALFALPDIETLPLAMYRLMGAYRMDQAAGAGLLLVGLSLGLFYICDLWGRRHALPK